MRVLITRIDPELPLPRYASEGAAGFDLPCREETTVAPGELGAIPTNAIVAVPQGYVLMVTLRSGTPRRKSLLSPHGVGIIDADFCGPEDEIRVLVFNFGDEPVTISRGECIAQGILLPCIPVTWEEGEPARNDSRGGFGSTGA